MVIDKLDDERRLLLINAGLKEFATRGYQKASTNTIAKEANMSKALMFHYVENKESLYDFLVEYCYGVLDNDYLNIIPYESHDILEMLRHSYKLQLMIMARHPWLFEFVELVNDNAKDEKCLSYDQNTCFERMISEHNDTLFKIQLPNEDCHEMIYWNNQGFSNQVLSELKETASEDVGVDKLTRKIDKYIDNLRVIFYAERGDNIDE